MLELSEACLRAAHTMLSFVLLHAISTTIVTLGAQLRAVPATQLRRGAQRMQTELLTASPATEQAMELLDDSTFAHAISRQQTLLVDFFSDSCGSCRSIESPLNHLHESGSVPVAKARIYECPTTYSWLCQHDIVVEALPTCVLFFDGKPVRHISGTFDHKRLEAFVDGRPIASAIAAPMTGRRKDITSARRVAAQTERTVSTERQLAAAVPLLFIGLLAVVTTKGW